MTAEVRLHAGKREFLDRAEAWLLTDEVSHNLLLGFARESSDDEAAFLATVERQGEVVACALGRPGLPLVLTEVAPALARRLAEAVGEADFSPDGVVGDPHGAAAFAERWSEISARPVVRGPRQRLHRLTRLRSLEQAPPGEMVWAGPDEIGLLTSWLCAFTRESGTSMPEERALVESLVVRNAAAVWRSDQRLRAMAAWTGRSERCARVSFVYTPPAERGRGWASALVHDLSAWLLDDGLEDCVLFTDIDNPVSNRIYHRLGYRPVRDLVELRWGSVRDGQTAS